MKIRSALVLALTATLVACEQDSAGLTGPEPVASSPARFSHYAAGVAVYPFQLRPDAASASAAWGEMVVRFGTRHPPSPCSSDPVPTNEQAVLSFCGVLHDPAGETPEDVTFRVTAPGSDGAVLTVRAGFEVPPSPCTTAILRGSLDLVGYPDPGPPGIGYPSPGPPTSEYPNPGPPNIELTLSTDAGWLVGYPSPGPPGIGYPSPGPPDVGYPDPGPPNARYPDPGPPTTCKIGVVDLTRS